MPPNVPRPFLALDGCRGLAACLVALFHFHAVFGITINSHVGVLPVVANAWLAVDFFFVLSGFVIAANYQEKLTSGAVRLRDFVMLRLGRLYPLQLFTLLLMLLIVLFFRYGTSGASHPTGAPADTSVTAFFANVLLVHGLHVLQTLTWNHPSWTISAEFATYIAFALAWRYLRGYSWILVALAIAGAPVLILTLHGTLNVTYDWGFLRAMLGFALGVVAFSVMQHAGARALLARLTRIEATIAELVLAFLAVAVVSIAGDTPLSLAAPFLFTGVVLLYSQEKGIVTGALSSAPARALGRWSYAIYMLHYPLQLLLVYAAVWIGSHGGLWLFGVTDGNTGAQAILGRSPWVGDAANVVMIVILLIASAWSYRVIEQPWRLRVRAKVEAMRR